MNIDPAEKMIKEGRIEKYIIRKAFDDKEKPWLPDSILWRQKEQFSDGVGYSWIDSLKAHAEKEVSDEMLKSAPYRFPYNTPTTKEGYYYRDLFHKHFPSDACAKTVPGGPSIACMLRSYFLKEEFSYLSQGSTPAAIEWEQSWKNMADPSGRAVAGVHQNSTSQ